MSWVVTTSEKETLETIFELQRVKTYFSKLCTTPLGDTPPCTQSPHRVKNTHLLP